MSKPLVELDVIEFALLAAVEGCSRGGEAPQRGLGKGLPGRDVVIVRSEDIPKRTAAAMDSNMDGVRGAMLSRTYNAFGGGESRTERIFFPYSSFGDSELMRESAILVEQ